MGNTTEDNIIRPSALGLRPGEIIIDFFAGGGGTSCGIEMALGRSPDIAINHDPEAIALHAANHPNTRHYCESVWDVDPKAATQGQPVGLAWFSPDCTFHSKARGGKPFRDRNRARRRRGLAWVVVRWAKAVRPRIIALENVEEFQDWGPLGDDGKPCKKRKGQTFRHWVARLRNLGYAVEWREQRACDYGAPTTRKRLFLVARCDGAPIVWPAPTHGPGLDPYRTAAECIDWSIPACSIFATPAEARAWAKDHGRGYPKRPLAEDTLKRIARGIKRYVLNNPAPFVVPLTHQGDRRVHPMGEPLPTITAAHRGELAVVAPYMARIGQAGGNGAYVNDVEEPLTTVTTKAEHLLVAPSLIQTGWGEREGQAPRCLNLHEPLGTVMADGVKHALVSAFLAKNYGGYYEGAGIQLGLPLDAITTSDHHSLVACHLQRDFGRSVGTPLDEPAGTITAGGGGKQALVTSHMVKLRGGLDSRESTAQDLQEPAPTLTAGGNHLAEVRAFLVKYNGQPGDPQLGLPLQTITTKDRFGLVMIFGALWAIADICMRMLEPHELYLAQGFPPSYHINVQYNGKPLTKEAQVRMCGNSVSPVHACALISAQVDSVPSDPTSWEPGKYHPAQQLNFLNALIVG